MMGKIIFFISSIVVAFIAGAQFNDRTKHANTSTAVAVQCEQPLAPKSIETTTRSFIGLESANETNISPNKDNPEEKYSVDEMRNEAPSESTSASAMLSSENFDHWLEENIERDSAFDIGDAMKKKFTQEERDYSWAENEENMLATLFFENPRLEGLALHDVECRTSQCQLHIAVNNLDQANETPSKLLEALASKQQFRQLVSSPNIVSGITTFYLSRDTNGLSLTSLD